MRFWRLDLSDSLKLGIAKSDPAIEGLGFKSLINLKTNGMYLVACPEEDFVEINSENVFFFTMGSRSYYTNGTRLYQLLGGSWVDLRAGISLDGIYFLDFVGYGILSNRTQTLYFDTSGVYTVNPTAFTTPRFNHAVTLNGQIIGAGVQSGITGIDEYYLAWGKIGSDDFSVDKMNDSGYYNPNIGICKKVIPFADKLLVIGSNGAVLMFYAEQTFGFKELNIPKSNSMYIAEGTKEFAYYIDHTDQLVQVSSNGEWKYLDYGWIMKDVVSSGKIGKTDEVIFSTSDMSYILNRSGLYSYGYKVYGDSGGKLVVEDGFEQSDVSFETGSLNTNLAGMKLLSEAFVGGNGFTNMVVQGVGVNSTISYGRSVPINSVDGAKLNVMANRVGIRFSADFKRTGRVQNLSVNIAKADRRFGTGQTSGG